jgi:pyruvate dehydrogenase E2 component (dihydrolipoamide acetyltransferase)
MRLEKITVPDFGGVQKITVIEVLVKSGDTVEQEAALIVLESEKAVMEIPSPFAGTIKTVQCKEGDMVKGGDLIAEIEVNEEAESTEKPAEAAAPTPAPPPIEAQPAPVPEEQEPAAESDAPTTSYHATPSVRAFARELGVDLAQVRATGPKGRILREDVQALVKQALAQPAGGPPGLSAPAAPLEDFSLHGPIEELLLTRIQKISGPHLHASWVGIPLVTHFDEADITELDRFRQQLQAEDGKKYSPLVFVVKAAVAALQVHPLCNSSLVPGEKIILKRYYHIGIAVDTPQGLTVPVLKHADRMGLRDIAAELARLSAAARAGKLTIGELQGASFTLSSLGGIGGTGFTPLVSAPQAAILGLSQSVTKPVWDGQAFAPRLILPFSVSYDHRIIDGAEAARFCRTLRLYLEDLKRSLV